MTRPGHRVRMRLSWLAVLVVYPLLLGSGCRSRPYVAGSLQPHRTAPLRAAATPAWHPTEAQAAAERELPELVKLRIAFAVSSYAHARVVDAFAPVDEEARNAWAVAQMMLAGADGYRIIGAPTRTQARNAFQKAAMDPRGLLDEIDARARLLEVRSFLSAGKDDDALVDQVYDAGVLRRAAPGLWQALASYFGGPDGPIESEAQRKQLVEDPNRLAYTLFRYAAIAAGSVFEPEGTKAGTVRATARTHEALRIWRQAWIDAPRELRTAFTPK